MSNTVKRGTIALAVAAAAVITGVWVGSAQGSASASSVPAWVPLPPEALAAAGVYLQAHDPAQHVLASSITTDQALNAATERVGKTEADTASATHVTFGDFFDSEYFTTRPDGTRQYVAQGVPAFVVTYEGVSVAHRGPNAGTNHEMNVVVDATTGQIIEAFSYR